MKRLIPVIFMALGVLVTACDSFRAGVFEDEMVMPLEGSEADSLFYKVSIQYASKGMLIPAMEAYKKKEFKDVAYFEPFYLKEFVAGISKKSIL